MAKRPTAYVRPQPATLSPDQIRQGVSRLTKRIGDVRAFNPLTVTNRRDPVIQTLEAGIKTTLGDVFGPDSQEYRVYLPAATIDTAEHNYAYQVPHGAIIEGLNRGKARAEMLLQQAITH